MGLVEEDFERFDAKFVRYEYDETRGVRLYDPYYRTSYDEYIGIDGWSAWSSEKDTFMSDILKGAKEEADRREALSATPRPEEIADALREKFHGKDKPDSN